MTNLFIALAVMGVILAGCVGTGICPIEKKYTQQEQDEFLNDMDRVKSKRIWQFTRDYRDLRRESRACRGED